MVEFALVAGVLGLAMVVKAVNDLGHASDDDYESAVGYNKPLGWAWTGLGLIVAIILWALIGMGV